jgi:Fe-S-cluster-containing dehydrogenase component
MTEADRPAPRWAKLLDAGRCIGCHACTTACKSENEVPTGSPGSAAPSAGLRR